MTGGRDEVSLGRTGDGACAFVDADRFGSFGGSAPRHRVDGRSGTELALGYVEPAKPAPGGRRRDWSRIG